MSKQAKEAMEMYRAERHVCIDGMYLREQLISTSEKEDPVNVSNNVFMTSLLP